jgi:hypothetical protein
MTAAMAERGLTVRVLELGAIKCGDFGDFAFAPLAPPLLPGSGDFGIAAMFGLPNELFSFPHATAVMSRTQLARSSLVSAASVNEGPAADFTRNGKHAVFALRALSSVTSAPSRPIDCFACTTPLVSFCHQARARTAVLLDLVVFFVVVIRQRACEFVDDDPALIPFNAAVRALPEKRHGDVHTL